MSIRRTTKSHSAFNAVRGWTRKGIVSLGVTGAAAGLLVAATATASAAPAQDYSSYSDLASASSWLDVAVSGGSTSPGAPIIQWWADGGAEQQWLLPMSYNIGEIINQNSGMCITTDGVAGDQVYQEPCTQAADQEWSPYNVFGPAILINRQSGLALDVNGNSYWGGAAIDTWPVNGGLNQAFWSNSE